MTLFAPLLPKGGRITQCCGSKVVSKKITTADDLSRTMRKNAPGILVFTKPPKVKLKNIKEKTFEVRYEKVKTRNGTLMFGYRMK